MDEHFHVVQARANWCVPACVVMVEAWRGYLPDDVNQRQAELMGPDDGGPVSLHLFQEWVGEYRSYHPEDQDAFLVLVQHLNNGGWAIVSVLPGWLRNRAHTSETTSPHGQLPGDVLPYHAVCLIGFEEQTFRFLDPWCDAAGQPLALSRVDFVQAWTGHALLADPEP